MSDRKGILRSLRIKRVAVVEMGANYDKSTGDGSHIMLFKSAGPNVGDVHVPTAGSEDDDDEYETDYEKANLSAEGRNSLPDSAFAAVWTDAKGKKRRKLPIHDAGHLAAARGRVDGANIPADVKAAARRKIEAATNAARGGSNKEKSVKKNWLSKMFGVATEPDPVKRAEMVAKAVEDSDDDGDEDDDAKKKLHKADDPMCKCAECMSKRTSKSVEEVMKDAIEKAVKAAVEPLQKALTGEIEQREMAAVRDILKSFKATPFDLKDDKDTKTYLALKRTSPEAFESVIKSMQATDAQLAQSKLYTDFGVRKGAGEGSAWAQIEAKAEQLMSKAGERMSKEAATEQVMLENPGLVTQYRQESM